MLGLRCGGVACCLHPALHVLTPVHVNCGSHKCTALVKDPMHVWPAAKTNVPYGMGPRCLTRGPWTAGCGPAIALPDSSCAGGHRNCAHPDQPYLPESSCTGKL